MHALQIHNCRHRLHARTHALDCCLHEISQALANLQWARLRGNVLCGAQDNDGAAALVQRRQQTQLLHPQLARNVVDGHLLDTKRLAPNQVLDKEGVCGLGVEGGGAQEAQQVCVAGCIGAQLGLERRQGLLLRRCEIAHKALGHLLLNLDGLELGNPLLSLGDGVGSKGMHRAGIGDNDFKAVVAAILGGRNQSRLASRNIQLQEGAVQRDVFGLGVKVQPSALHHSELFGPAPQLALGPKRATHFSHCTCSKALLRFETEALHGVKSLHLGSTSILVEGIHLTNIILFSHGFNAVWGVKMERGRSTCQLRPRKN
eukprot:m.223381 g.223381  ORF g.223381 m.223381 type:complete len:316 (+) comp16245_c0_seq1:744-1691(+)